MVYEGITPDEMVRVTIDTTDASLVIEKRLRGSWVVTTDYRAPNLRVLSEHLSDEVGYGYAVDLLKGWEIDSTSPLWNLNRKG